MIGYFLIAIYLKIFLQYDYFSSDVKGYWQDSLEWQTPFNFSHVPTYPLMVAILRGITLGVFHPISLMMTINLIAFLASSFIIYKIIQKGGASDKLATFGTLLFGLWPFIGLTYTVNPLADMPAMFFFLLGLLLLQKSQRIKAAFSISISVITHKAMLFFILFLIIIEIYRSKKLISKENLLFLLIILMPIGILWLIGFYYHNSLFWIFSNNLKGNITLVPFSGLFGTFLEGTAKGLIKGSVLLSVAFISVFCLYLSIKIRYKYFQYGIIISLATIFLFIFINQYTIWAAMRFGRLLVVPLAFITNAKMKYNKISWWSTPATIAVLILLFLSQFVYSWYWACVYFG